jgi:hypothetical protein
VLLEPQRDQLQAGVEHPDLARRVARLPAVLARGIVPICHGPSISLPRHQ